VLPDGLFTKLVESGLAETVLLLLDLLADELVCLLGGEVVLCDLVLASLEDLLLIVLHGAKHLGDAALLLEVDEVAGLVVSEILFALLLQLGRALLADGLEPGVDERDLLLALGPLKVVDATDELLDLLADITRDPRLSGGGSGLVLGRKCGDKVERRELLNSGGSRR